MKTPEGAWCYVFCTCKHDIPFCRACPCCKSPVTAACGLLCHNILQSQTLSRTGLAALLACATPTAPPAVCEGALDALCAAATHTGRRAALVAAGGVEAAAAVVSESSDSEVLVRSLMLLGMLAGGSAEGQGRLVEAGGGRAAVRLLGLARQDQDQDCKVGTGGSASSVT